MNLNKYDILKFKLLIKNFLFSKNLKIYGNKIHLIEAIKWLARAQDATPDIGVSCLHSPLNGWKASYPETTTILFQRSSNMQN
jgi:hypothetical protein